MLPTNTSAYVVTSPYSAIQVPITLTRPVAVAPSLFYEPNNTSFIQPMVFTTVSDKTKQKNIISEAKNSEANMGIRESINLTVPAFVHSTPQLVYTSVVNDLINHQSYLNLEKQIDDKINKTVNNHIQKYTLDKLEESFKKGLPQYDTNLLKHVYENHENTNDFNHICEHTQANQNDLSPKDKKCCCCSTHHNISVCDDCIKSTTDCCLEEKIRRIREELNLPPENKIEHDNHELSTQNKPKVEFIDRNYEIKVPNRRSRSQSKSANFERPKSRSPSLISRPEWKPIGANDYSWTNQTRSEILNGQYEKSEKLKKANKINKGNQTTLLPNDITVIYPTKTIHQYEYHEVPVKSEKNKTKLTLSTLNSKNRSNSPICHSKNYQEYHQRIDNYNYTKSETKSTIIHNTNNVKPYTEVYCAYETVKPKLKADHYHEKNFFRYPLNTDYFYYESKPKVTCEKSTSTISKNAVSTQTYAEKNKASSLEYLKDCNNKVNVYIK